MLRGSVVTGGTQLLEFVGARSGEVLQVLERVVGDAGFQRDSVLFQGGLDGVVAGARDVVFQHGLAHGARYLHLLSPLAEPEPASGVGLELAREFVSSYRRHVLIVPDSQVLDPVAEGRAASGLGCRNVVE